MKILDVRTNVLKYKLKEAEIFAYSQTWVEERTAMIVEIFTDEGVVGLGEAYGPPEITSVIIDRLFKPLIIGENPLNIEMIWHKLYNMVIHFETKGMAIAAISGIDIALWDIMGKVTNLPVCQLLGGRCRDKMLAYVSHIYYKKQQDVAEEATQFIEDGFKAVKMKIGWKFKEDVERVRRIRETIGDGVKLMVDANCCYNERSAIEIGKKLEQYDIYWFEEPVPPDDVAGYLSVKRALNMKIAGGESEFTRWGFKDIISKKAVDIVQPDCCNVGGLTEARNIARMASAWNIQCMPHVWNAGVGIAAALQFAASILEFPLNLCNPSPILFEVDRSTNPFREELLNEQIVALEDGFIQIPNRPGLGITLNRDSMKKFSIKK